MDSDQLKEKYLPFIKEHALALVMGVVGVGCLGVGAASMLMPQGDSDGIVFEVGAESSGAKAQTRGGTQQITVDVEGAVLKPGIHKLPAESRVQDALIAAGGMSEKADRQKVARSMNLAAKVIDGGKIYIPFEGEVAGAVSGGVGGLEGGEGLGNQAFGLINVNTASESELDSLNGVGPATAQKIIKARPYASVDQLLSKKVVGKSVFEKIKEKVSVN